MGTERLRITPLHNHEDAMIDALAEALLDVWQRLDLPLEARALAAELPARRYMPNDTARALPLFRLR